MQLEKLTWKPIDVQVTGHFSTGRQWIVLVYEYTGTLTTYGIWLENLVDDLEKNGLYVTQISTGKVGGIRPNNDSPDDYKNRGRWKAHHVEISIRDQVEADMERAQWLEAARQIIKGRL